MISRGFKGNTTLNSNNIMSLIAVFVDIRIIDVYIIITTNFLRAGHWNGARDRTSG